MILDRRVFACGLFSTVSYLSLSRPLRAGITEDQRKEYSRQFQTGGANRRELSILRDIQENRIALPSGRNNLNSFITESPAMIALETGVTPALGMLKFWHDLAIQATSLDHTTEGQDTGAFEQNGPARTSRALAMVHLAIFEAINTITPRFKSYKSVNQKILLEINLSPEQISTSTASIDRAIIESSYAMLVSLYPNKKGVFDTGRISTLSLVAATDSQKDVGSRVGIAAFNAISALRKLDGSDRPDLTSDDFKTADPFGWQQDPITRLKPALGGNWHRVKPFVVASSEKYRPEPPPSVDSAAFIEAFKEVKKLGGDPNAPALAPRWPTRTVRTGTLPSDPLNDANETFKGNFWGYDGTALLCAPPRLYNMIVTSIAFKEKPVTDVLDLARLLALTNVAMADAAICAWEAKYFYAFARPITAIRATGVDATPEGSRDPNWTPLGAPVSNGLAVNKNLTPPFPSYPSGHATFGGALFQVLRNYWSVMPDGIQFDFVSDEYNNQNRGPGDEAARPKVVRTISNFTVAEIENARSRVWLGIHWQFDADAGISQGRKIGDDVFNNILQPI